MLGDWIGMVLPILFWPTHPPFILGLVVAVSDRVAISWGSCKRPFMAHRWGRFPRGGFRITTPTPLPDVASCQLIWQLATSGSVVPVAKKDKLGPIFSKNIRVMYILSVKKRKTGQKTGKNPPKKGVFISTSDHLSNFWRQQLLRPATFRASNSYWLAQNWWTNRSPPPSHDSDWYQQMALIANSIDGRFASYRSY